MENRNQNQASTKVTWSQIWAAMDRKTRQLFLWSCASLLAASLTLGFGFGPHFGLYPFHADWMALPWLLAFSLFAMAGGLLQKAAQENPPISPKHGPVPRMSLTHFLWSLGASVATLVTVCAVPLIFETFSNPAAPKGNGLEGYGSFVLGGLIAAATLMGASFLLWEKTIRMSREISAKETVMA